MKGSAASFPSLWRFDPCVGIGPIQIGMSRKDVRKALGPPCSVERKRRRLGVDFPATDYFHENAVQVTYADGRVDFIGVSYQHQPMVVVEYSGVQLFDVIFRDLALWLVGEVGVDAIDREFPASWDFPALCLSLYRSCDEQDIEQEARDAGDSASLFVEQVAIDKRFAAAAYRATPKRALPGVGLRPTGGKRAADPRRLWAEIAKREASGSRWKGLVEALRASTPLPTENWRRRMAGGDRIFTPAKIEASERILREFLQAVWARPALEVLRTAVESFNALGGFNGSMGNFIETVERDELATFLLEVARAAGARGKGDLTEQWREW